MTLATVLLVVTGYSRSLSSQWFCYCPEHLVSYPPALADAMRCSVNVAPKIEGAFPAAIRCVGRAWAEEVTAGQADGTRAVGVVETAVARLTAVQSEDGAVVWLVGGAVRSAVARSAEQSEAGAALVGAEAEMQSEAAAAADDAGSVENSLATIGYALTEAVAVAVAGTGNNSVECLVLEPLAHAAEWSGTKSLARFVECTTESCPTPLNPE